MAQLAAVELANQVASELAAHQVVELAACRMSCSEPAEQQSFQTCSLPLKLAVASACLPLQLAAQLVAAELAAQLVACLSQQACPRSSKHLEFFFPRGHRKPVGNTKPEHQQTL